MHACAPACEWLKCDRCQNSNQALANNYFAFKFDNSVVRIKLWVQLLSTQIWISIQIWTIKQNSSLLICFTFNFIHTMTYFFAYIKVNFKFRLLGIVFITIGISLYVWVLSHSGCVPYILPYLWPGRRNYIDCCTGDFLIKGSSYRGSTV